MNQNDKGGAAGATLLALQRTDLDIARAEGELAELPVLRELAKKRKSLARLKAEAVKLLGERKDAQTDLADLDAEEASCHEAVAAAQARPADPSDYHRVQELEEELSSIAKRLDRASFLRAGAEDRLAAAEEKERRLADYIERFEKGVLADARTAREEAGELQGRIADLKSERERTASSLPAEALAAYGRASERFRGLAVESLEGEVPSICRTKLQPASLDRLRRGDSVAECPYCHRILVVDAGDEA